MKRSHIYTLAAMIAACILLAGCKDAAEVPEPAVSSADIAVITPEPVPETADENIMPDPVTPVNDPEDEAPDTEEAAKPDNEADGSKEDTSEEGSADAGSDRTIVWLGDSLTQGSLGEDNDNVKNAPYVKLRSLVKNKVEGYGFYGHKTHDIFWLYRDEGHFNQSVDPGKIYIFWVGSCDWCPDDGENTNTAPVISEIDNFLAAGPVKDYIVIGTTQRWRLGLDRAKIINADLQAKYGSHYIDVIDIIAANGFSSDNTHLSQASYDAIAAAVCNKLKALGYI